MNQMAAQQVTGHCLCGAVTFTAVAKTMHVDACHCSMCRRWSAGPLLAIDCGDSVKVADPSQLGVYRSSDWAERCFCKTCGASLFYRLVDKPFYAVSVETLDDLTGFTLATEIFIDEKPAYYAFANETKKMTGAEAMATFADASATE